MKQVYCKYYRELGFNIAYYRKMKSWTQEVLAEKLGIDQTHMSKIEVASVGVSLDVLFKLSEVLEVPVKKFFEFRDSA